MGKLAQAIGSVDNRGQATIDFGSLPRCMQRVSVADVEIAGRYRACWIQVWNPCQVEAHVTPGKEPVTGIPSRIIVGGGLETKTLVVGERRAHVPDWQNRCYPLKLNSHHALISGLQP